MRRKILTIACNIAEHAGWYVHYGKVYSLTLGLRSWTKTGIKRGMKYYQFYDPLMDIYIIDGSTCRRERVVMLAKVGEDKWILIVEIDKWFHEEYWVKGKYSIYRDYIRYELELNEKEALTILECYWVGALINKDVYQHYKALWNTMKCHIETLGSD